MSDDGSSSGNVPLVGSQTAATDSLHAAAQQGDLAKLRELIESREASAMDRTADGVTALHWAAINSRVDCCAYLLDHGADANFAGGDLIATPLHWSARYVVAAKLR